MNRQNFTFTLLATSLLGLTLGVDRAHAFSVKFTKIANVNDNFTDNNGQPICVPTDSAIVIDSKELTLPTINRQNVSFGFICTSRVRVQPRGTSPIYYFTTSPSRKLVATVQNFYRSATENVPTVRGGRVVFVDAPEQVALAQNNSVTPLVSDQTPFFKQIAARTDFAEIQFTIREQITTGYFPPAASNNTSVLFFASSRIDRNSPELVRGLYLRNSKGEFRTIAQTGTQAQAGKNFGTITKAFDVTDGFAAFATDRGVYLDRSGKTSTALDLNKLKPFGYQSISRYCGLSAEGNRLAVCVAGQSANDPLATSVYVVQNNNLREVVKNGATTPQGITVDQIDQVAIDGNNVAFVDRKRSPAFNTLYVNANGKLNVVASAGARGGGTQIDGKTVQSLSISRQAIDGNSIVFLVTFSDNEKAIYKADFKL
jgi:hypothetical protein